jgi:hypothetical protein
MYGSPDAKKVLMDETLQKENEIIESQKKDK